MRLTVETESVKPKPRKAPEPPAKDKKLPQYMPIPKKYSNKNTSGLKYTVKEGKQTFNIDLK